MAIACDSLSGIPHLRHGFFGRRGGVSDGLYDSLNCGLGSGDDLEKISENRRRVSEAIGSGQPLLTCFQIHSANVVTVDEPWEWKNSPEADALVTNKPGMPIGLLTADCLPVLFADTRKKIIGAAHAGWKGAFGGVLEATIASMKLLGATEIIAAIGPSIGQQSYEVGPEFYARFMEQGTGNAVYFLPSEHAGHYYFNLAAYAQARMSAAGIAQSNILAYDTCSLENEFFSYRRSCMRGETVYGRQVAAIVME